MSRITGSIGNDPPEELQNTLKQKRVCPFCGAVLDAVAGACKSCGMDDTPASRQATKARIGPWFVLQSKNPSAPGMRFATMIALVKKGQITPRSIVRGPTTHQLWRFAARVRGLSREFGICYGCGGQIQPVTATCPHCQRAQEPPVNPNILMDIRKPATPPVTTTEPAPAPALVSREPATVPATIAAASGATVPPPPSSTPSITPSANPSPAPSARPSAPVRLGGDKILSPHDLAAAFRLDFKGPRAPGAPVSSGLSANRVAAAVDEDVLQHLPASTKRPSEPVDPDKPKFRVGRAIAWTALWALVAFGIAFFTIPGFQEKVVAWSDQARQSMGIDASKQANIDPDVRKQFESLQNESGEIEQAISPADIAPEPPPKREIEVTDVNAQPASGTVMEPEITSNTTTIAIPPAPNTQTEPVATAPVATAPATPVATAPAAPKIKPINSETRREVMEIWLLAIDAETRRAYAEEITLLEQIRSEYPREIWPGGLEVRLANARRFLTRVD